MSTDYVVAFLYPNHASTLLVPIAKSIAIQLPDIDYTEEIQVYGCVPISNPQFCFRLRTSIDGVLLRSSRALPGASESLQLLQRENIPFVLLTNGGGMHETERTAQLSEHLHIPLDTDMIIQSHTPFAELVKDNEEQYSLRDKCVLVVGGVGGKCRSVAQRYGFKSVVTPGDVFSSHPEIWPFSDAFNDFYRRFTTHLPRKIDAVDPSKSLKIDAILVFNDPRDWALDIQLIIDILLSSQGIVGTYSPKNNNPDLPNRGYQQDGQPPLYFSNPDLLWSAQYHRPRLGQGGFKAALEGVWAAMTKGASLETTVIGKPCELTYRFAEKRLNLGREKMFGTQDLQPLEAVYMIGDNPESDIRGANSYESPIGTKWNSILVKTGVYSDGKPAWPPRIIVDDVKQAVEWGLMQSRWPRS
ncbi:aspartyl-tRNA synthetase [Paracoccidioides lutzii Pb01]|uniref:Aspartyl-tRNA synthetase n=1 Tax=Paracoccidioides lutzii (strain ATCC MYA-826 / Pb01) TaxID=502779 RepID=C1H2X5_PARBA|nr:aspartyl-tRNA synthetase [Paracoccidioides lutzii Pb01]EEH34069.2 aspartyl-tRNA synthetase [Paracoccidioides lutzii Pb01]